MRVFSAVSHCCFPTARGTAVAEPVCCWRRLSLRAMSDGPMQLWLADDTARSPMVMSASGNLQRPMPCCTFFSADWGSAPARLNWGNARRNWNGLLPIVLWVLGC